MLAIILLGLVAATLAQTPVPCTSPPQWEARIYDNNEEQGFQVFGRFSYDSVNHRERLVEDVEQGRQDDFYDSVSLFDIQTEFIYNFRARNCTRRPITRAWRNFAVNPNDTSYGEAYLGSSAVAGANVLTTIWGGNFTTPSKEVIQFISQWTYLACIPIARTTFSKTFGISHLQIYDVTAGIHDPNVFIPRRECLSAEEWENRYTLFAPRAH